MNSTLLKGPVALVPSVHAVSWIVNFILSIKDTSLLPAAISVQGV